MKGASQRLSIPITSNLAIALVRKGGENEKFLKNEYFKSILDTMKSDSNALTAAYKQPRVAKNLEQADNARMNDIKAIRAHIKSALYSKDEAKKNAAKQLTAILDNYKGLSKGRMSKKTADINSLLADFEKEEVAASIELINELSLYIEDLRADEVAFEKQDDAHVDMSNAKGETASVIKTRILSLINGKFLAFVDVMADMEKGDYLDYARFVEKEIIAANNTLVKKKDSKQAEQPNTNATV